MKPSSKKLSAPTAVPLVPERLSYIFDHRPVLWFEDESAYETLRADHFAHYAPESIIDYHAVKEIVDEQWEINRLHRIQRAAIESEMPDVIVDKLGPDYWVQRLELGVNGDKDELKRYALKAMQREESGKSLMDDLLKVAGMNCDNLLYRTFSKNLLMSSALNERLDRAERRRDALAKKYHERRGILGAMKRSLIEGEKAAGVTEVLDAELGPKGGLKK